MVENWDPDIIERKAGLPREARGLRGSNLSIAFRSLAWADRSSDLEDSGRSSGRGMGTRILSSGKLVYPAKLEACGVVILA